MALGGGTAALGSLIPNSSHRRWITRGARHSQSLPVLMLLGAFTREKLERKFKPLYVRWEGGGMRWAVPAQTSPGFWDSVIRVGGQEQMDSSKVAF